MNAAQAPEPLLEMTGISKSFGGNPVLSDVDFTLYPHEVHALVGENGAGKSTLMKILNGVHPRDAGSIRLAGRELRIASPHDARRAGISMIFQEHTLADHLSVAENIYLGREPMRARGILDNQRAVREAGAVLESYGFPVLPTAPVSRLTRGEKQLVEIARALATSTRVVVMDEPTAVLSHTESEYLFRIIGDLKARGLAVVYISHRLEELGLIADRITILRDGKRVYTGRYDSIDSGGIIRHMVGREITELYPGLPAPRPEVRLEARGLSGGTEYRNVSFQLHRGEILGFAGLVGSGRTALARGIFGLEPPSDGLLLIDGREARVPSVPQSIARGLGHLTEDRKGGVFPQLALVHNISMAGLGSLMLGPFLRLNKEAQRARELIGKMDIRARSERQPAGRLSGGNQQKALLARWLFAGSHILLLDEPTQGVDLGTRAGIYRLMGNFIAEGGSILMISSDLPELLGMTHRIAVMRRGELAATLSTAATSQEEVMRYAALDRT
ncbi:MAG: sugar ABC transporter ATP-binding protein [Bryobacterales bacterium]|nr:sugar ABC transporter ATP-binding protein [Bryobacterales bacterium]